MTDNVASGLSSIKDGNSSTGVGKETEACSTVAQLDQKPSNEGSDDGNTQDEDDEDEDDNDDDDDDDEDDEDEDEEPRLKYARLTSNIAPVYRNGDATSSFLVSADKMIIGTHGGIVVCNQILPDNFASYSGD